ncbi:hypothetical protein GGS26DRAFT_502742 [Hypomontagnella submonticulosa]|nr:hypothetical protein GGS26DRAFT_502742 [Hypomontagnella submonticulosa]
MAGNQGFVHLSGPGAPNGPSKPQGSAPHPAGPGGGRPAGPPPGNIPQQSGPPRSGFQSRRTGYPSVEISDVSRDLLTIDDMREDLTEFAIYRFEKMPVQRKYDDEGTLKRATWDQALRTRVSGLSQREITRQIQHLNRDTRALTDKLKSLSPVLQRQIDAAQEHLVASLDDREATYYQWVLVQLDHQLKEIFPYITTAGGNHSLPRGHHGSTRRRSYSGTSRNKGRPRAFERVSLMAYFKKAPRPNVDIPMLYEAKKRSLNQQNGPGPQQHHPQQHLGQDPRGPGQGVGSQGAVGPNGGRGGGGGGGGGGGIPPPPRAPPNGPQGGGKPPNNTAFGNGGRGKGGLGKHNNPNNRESDTEEYSSSDASLDSQLTPGTSLSSGSRGQGGARVPLKNMGGMRGQNGYGQASPKRHEKPEPIFDFRDGPRMPSVPGQHLPPRPPLTPPLDYNRARDDAYLAGIRAGRDDERFAQQRALREAWHSRPRPRVISAGRPPDSPYRGRMTSSEAGGYRRLGDLDDEISRLDRLSLDDDEGYERVLRREEARRRREYDDLEQRGSVLDDDPFISDRPAYLKRGGRYREMFVTDESDSDYTISPRNRREYRY